VTCNCPALSPSAGDSSATAERGVPRLAAARPSRAGCGVDTWQNARRTTRSNGGRAQLLPCCVRNAAADAHPAVATLRARPGGARRAHALTAASVRACARYHFTLRTKISVETLRKFHEYILFTRANASAVRASRGERPKPSNVDIRHCRQLIWIARCARATDSSAATAATQRCNIL
jgi:hypothetical protein